MNLITAFAPAMHQQQYSRSCLLYFLYPLLDGAWIVLELPSQGWLHGSTEPPADHVRRIVKPPYLPFSTTQVFIQPAWIYLWHFPSIRSILSVSPVFHIFITQQPANSHKSYPNHDVIIKQTCVGQGKSV